jgi:hypothetical protein
MVEVKVRKFGNSLGVILLREVLARLQSGDAHGFPVFFGAGGGAGGLT